MALLYLAASIYAGSMALQSLAASICAGSMALGSPVPYYWPLCYAAMICHPKSQLPHVDSSLFIVVGGVL